MPDPIDVEVGRRAKARRQALGLSQESLADALGVTFQQVQKYEKGTNRISASRLIVMSQVLQMPIADFFDDIRDPGPEDPLVAFLSSSEGQQLNRAFARISDAKVRARVIGIVKAIADAD